MNAKRKGKVYSFVPSDTLKENLYAFDLGGIYFFDRNLLKTKNVIPVKNDSRSLILDEIQINFNIEKINCCFLRPR